MGDDGQFIIRIGIPRGDVSGAEQAEQALHKSRQAAEEFIHTLKLGVGIDLGGKLVESIQEIPNLLREATAEGVKFNAFLETTQIAIAGSLRSVDPSLTWQQAKQEGSEAIDLLRKKANELGLDFETLAETYKVNAPTLAHAGIKDVQQQIDTIALLNQVAAAKGIQGFQAQRDIIDILNGQGNRTLLGKELESQGVDMKELENAERLGTLYDYLTEKLGAFKQAGQDAAQSLNGEMNTLHNEIQQALGEGAKPVFETLKQGVAELNEALADPQAANALKALGHDAANLVGAGLQLIDWAVKLASQLVPVAETAGLVAVAFSAMKIKDIVVGMMALAGNVDRIANAVAAENTALAENTERQEANATARMRMAEAAAAEASAAQAATAAYNEPYNPGHRTGVSGAPAVVTGEDAAMNEYARRRGFTRDEAEAEVGGFRSGEATNVAESEAAALAMQRTRDGLYKLEQEGPRVANAFERMQMAGGKFIDGLVALDARLGGLLTVVGTVMAIKGGSDIWNNSLDMVAGYGATGRIRSGTSREDIENANELQASQSERLQELFAKAKNITTREGRDALMKEIGDYQTSLAQSIDPNDAHAAMSNEVTEQTVKALSGLANSLAKMDDAALQSLWLDQTIAAQKQRQLQAEQAMSAAREELKAGAKDRAERQADETVHDAASHGDVAAVDKAIAAKRAELETAQRNLASVANRGDSAGAKAAATGINDIQDQIDELNRLRADAEKAAAKNKEAAEKKSDADAEKQGKKNDEATIKQLEHQRAAAEEMGKARIAQLEAVGGKEDDIARKRKEIEDEVAAQRLAIEDKIGFLQKETPEDRQARHDLAASQQTERNADLAKTLREHKEKAQGDAWDKNRLPGRIDARTQRVVGANGDDLEFHGVAKYGRDAMGEPLQPSMLDSMHGAGWDQPRRKFGDVMPPASQPGGSHTDAQGLKQPVDQTAAALAEVKQSLTVLANSARELAGTAKQTAQQVDAASRETGTSMSGQARTVTQTAAVVKEAVAATEKAMEEIQRELHDMQRREADGRHR